MSVFLSIQNQTKKMSGKIVDTQKTIERLEKQLRILDDLKSSNHESSRFQKWHRDTRITLENIPIKGDKYRQEFGRISFRDYCFVSPPNKELNHVKCYQEGIKEAKVLLQSIIDEIKEYGLDCFSMPSESKTVQKFYVDPSRIKELQSISSSGFDLSRLVRYCEELNICYQRECFLAIPMLVRAILDHIPPIFGKNSFGDFLSQYGAKSFKGSMTHLDKSLRNIADSFLHSHIQKKVSLPNATQINFSQDLDVLLGEIYSKLK